MKQEYKTKYQKMFKEEEKTEKKQQSNVVKESKKKIRDDFLNNFFLPLRQEFESQKAQYEALWSIKAKDMTEEPVEIEIIYSFENVLKEQKLN